MKTSKTYGTPKIASYSFSGYQTHNGYEGYTDSTRLTARTEVGATDAYGSANDRTITTAYNARFNRFRETIYSEAFSYTMDESGYRTNSAETVAHSTSKRIRVTGENGLTTSSKATIPYVDIEGEGGDTTAVAKTSYINEVSTSAYGDNSNTYRGSEYNGLAWIETTKSLQVNFLLSTYTKETLSESYWNNNATSYRTTELALYTHIPTTTSVIVPYSTRTRHPKKLGLSIFTGFSYAITTRYEAEYREYLRTRSPETPEDEYNQTKAIFKIIDRAQKDYGTWYTKLYEGTYSGTKKHVFRSDSTLYSTEATLQSFRYLPTSKYVYSSTEELTWSAWTWDDTGDPITENVPITYKSEYIGSSKAGTTISTTHSMINRVSESFAHSLDKTIQVTLNSGEDTYTKESIVSNSTPYAIKLEDTNLIIVQKSAWATTKLHNNKNTLIQTRTTSSTQYYKLDEGGIRSKVTNIASTYAVYLNSARTITYPLGTHPDQTSTSKIDFSISNSATYPARSSSSSVANVTYTYYSRGVGTLVGSYTRRDVSWDDATLYQNYFATGEGLASKYNTVTVGGETYAPMPFLSKPTYKNYEVTDDIYNVDRIANIEQYKTTYFLPKFVKLVSDENAIEIKYSEDKNVLPLQALGRNIYSHHVLKDATHTIYAFSKSGTISTYRTSSETFTETYEIEITDQFTDTITNTDQTDIYPKSRKNKIYVTSVSAETETKTFTRNWELTDTIESATSSYVWDTSPFFTSTLDEMFVSMSLFGSNTNSKFSDYLITNNFPDYFTVNTLDNSETGTYSSSYSTTSSSMRPMEEMEDYAHQERVYDHAIKTSSLSNTNYKYSVALTSTQVLDTIKPNNTNIVPYLPQAYGTTVIGGWNYDGNKLTASIINRNLGYVTMQTAKIAYSHTNEEKWGNIILRASETQEFPFDGSYCTQIRRKPLITSAEQGGYTTFEESVSIGANKFPDPHRPRYFSYTATDVLDYAPKDTSDVLFKEFWETGMLAKGLVYFPYTSTEKGKKDTVYTFFEPDAYLELQKKINDVNIF